MTSDRHRSWDEFPISETGGPPPEVESGTYVAVDSNGYGRLTAWAAGPRRAFRVPARLSDFQPVQVEITDGKTGATTTRLDTVSQADLDMVDEMGNEYLAEAGVDPMPSGFHWYVLVPRECGYDDLQRALRGANMAPTPAHAKDLIALHYDTFVKPIDQ